MSFDDSIAYTTKINATSTDMIDFIEKIKDFCVDQAGFTLIAEKQEGLTSLDKYIVVETGGIYYHFQTYFINGTELEGKIFININKSFNNSNTFWKQAGTPSNRNAPTDSATKSLPMSVGGSPQFYLFWNTKNLHIVAEYKTGFFSHAQLGLANSYTNSETYYMNSTVHGNYTSFNALENSFSMMFGQDSVGNYEIFENNILLPTGNVVIDGQDLSRTSSTIGIPSFTNKLKQGSEISTLNKSLLWSASAYVPNRNRTYYSATAKHSDSFLTWTDSYFDTEEFLIGIKKFKFFPFYQKIVPANINRPGQGCGICLRIE